MLRILTCKLKENSTISKKYVKKEYKEKRDQPNLRDSHCLES